jgi:hypothetical protein
VSNPIDQLYNRAWYFSLIFEGWVRLSTLFVALKKLRIATFWSSVSAKN